MSNVNHFVTSDTHFYHKKIMEYCNRDFESVEEMNDYIISKWNSVVNPDDKVYHLGDFSLYAKKQQVKDIVSRLNGYIILIKGNHDRKSTHWYYDCGFYEVYSHSIIYNYGYNGLSIVMSHKPVPPTHLTATTYNIHGHLHNNSHGYSTHLNVGFDKFNTPMNIDDIIVDGEWGLPWE